MRIADSPVLLWPPVLATSGPGDASGEHAHHALHLVLACEGSLRARVAPARRAVEAAGVLTRPDVPHAIDARGRTVILVFVEPESDEGAALLAGLDGPARWIDEALRDRLLAALPAPRAPDFAAWMPTVLAALGPAGAVPPRTMHPRVRRVIRALRDRAPDEDTSAAALAARVGLSESHLLHAFTASVGIPLRRYALWLKVQRAAVAIARGASLAEAAHGAGFSDASHMTRTFRRTFGLPPSSLAKTAQTRERTGRWSP